LEKDIENTPYVAPTKPPMIHAINNVVTNGGISEFNENRVHDHVNESNLLFGIKCSHYNKYVHHTFDPKKPNSKHEL
jgi:hypothetical protein